MSKSRNTRQKEEISRIAAGFEGFFTSDDILARLRKKGSDISRATVYRYLKSLNRAGIIHRFTCGRRRVYSNKNRNHCHFICHICGKTEHFEVKKIDFIKEGEMGHACHFQLDVHGVCRKCLASAAKE